MMCIHVGIHGAHERVISFTPRTIAYLLRPMMIMQQNTLPDIAFAFARKFQHRFLRLLSRRNSVFAIYSFTYWSVSPSPNAIIYHESWRSFIIFGRRFEPRFNGSGHGGYSVRWYGFFSYTADNFLFKYFYILLIIKCFSLYLYAFTHIWGYARLIFARQLPRNINTVSLCSTERVFFKMISLGF